MKQAQIDKAKGPPGALTSAEKEELVRLRKEVRELREDREIPKKRPRPSSRSSTSEVRVHRRHSDQGIQYTSEGFQRVLAERGITCSMSRRGNCYDNAAMESWVSTLKSELGERFENHAAAKDQLFDYIEVSTTSSAGTRYSAT